MNKKDYLKKLANRIRISFYILLFVAIYEVWYWLTHSSSLSFVLVILASAVTLLSFTLMQALDDMSDKAD